MLNLERLRVLHAVSGAGSVRGAAETLHVTTSAISQQLKALERDVGQALVERLGRGIRLTDAGSVLAEHAGRLLAQVERVEADLAARRGSVAGELRLAAFATAARGLVPPVLKALKEKYPALRLRLDELEPTEAIPALCRADLDLAIIQDWPDAPVALPDGIAGRHLFDDVLEVALPADHSLATRAHVSLAELAGEDWITWTDGQLCHDWLCRSLDGPVIAHTASEHSTQLALVDAGMGVAMMPRLGREPIPDGVRVVPVRPRLCRRVHVLWRRSAEHRPAITAVVRALCGAGAPSGDGAPSISSAVVMVAARPPAGEGHSEAQTEDDHPDLRVVAERTLLAAAAESKLAVVEIDCLSPGGYGKRSRRVSDTPETFGDCTELA